MKLKNENINIKYQYFIFILLYSFIFALFLASYHLSLPSEDAVILYEYSKNLANKGVITYGGALSPIEGATDFLWMIMIAFLKFFGVNEFGSALSLNFLALAFSCFLFKDFSHKIIFGIALLITPFLYSSLLGFSTIFFSAALLFSLKLLFDKSKYLHHSLLILCLIRPDGLVFAISCILIEFLHTDGVEAFKSKIKSILYWLVIPGLIYFIARYIYFGELFPLPFYVKGYAPRGSFIFYKDSLISISKIIIPLFITLAFFTRSKKEATILVLFLLLPVLFYGLLKLEQNVGNRFMAPIFFGSLFLIARLYGTKALKIFIVCSLLNSYAQTFNIITQQNIYKNHDSIYSISKELRTIKGRMLTSEAGTLAYYSNWNTEDSWGLNTPRFAKKLISQEDIADGDYDLIVGHCDLALLGSIANLEHNQLKTWDNQCKVLISHIKKYKYEIFLVPVIDNKDLFAIKNNSIEICHRHDIFAISANYQKKLRLKEILYDHGALNYTDELKLNGSDLVCR